MSRSKTPPCSRDCGQRVWFDWSAKAGEPGRSDFGKLRPLQVSEDGEMLNEIHDCPNSDWNKKQQSRQVPTTSITDTTTAYSAGNMEAVLGNTMDAIARIEKLDNTMNMIGTLDQQLSQKIDKLQHDIDELIPRFNQLVEHLVHNPLDDDGDSQREEATSLIADSEPLFTCEERLEACEVENKELREALRKEIHFRTARDMQGPIKQIWLPVMNVIDIFHKAYQIRNHVLANNRENVKLIFTISNEGRIIDVVKSEEDEP